MIVDSSALVAVLLNEAERDVFARMLSENEAKVGAPTLLETSIVVRRRRQPGLDDLVRSSEMQVVPFDAAHLDAARHAYASYGRGSGHPARLNFGDCMSYALAKVTGEPLLFKGDDFAHTDVTPAHVP